MDKGAAYSASMAAIVGIRLPAARDLMCEGIRANTIMPGLSYTPLMQPTPEDVKVAPAASVFVPRRVGEPDEFAALVEFVLTNSYLNGESVRLDGVMCMAPR